MKIPFGQIIDLALVVSFIIGFPWFLYAMYEIREEWRPQQEDRECVCPDGGVDFSCTP